MQREQTAAIGFRALQRLQNEQPHFPKNQSAQDLMMSAPTQVPPEQLRDLHVRVVEPPQP